MAKIHRIQQGKGSVGKSATATMLAQYKASKSHKTLRTAYRKGSKSSRSEIFLDDVRPTSTSSSAFRSGSGNYDSPLATSTADYSSTSTPSSFEPGSGAQDGTNAGAEKWNAKEPGAASRNVPDKDPALKRSGATGYAGQTGPELDTADTFDENYLAEGKVEFKLMAPELWDFVNRSRSSS